ncbi:hypothetical protein ANCCAN_27149 [Ancylostoma caninum]|uniref:Uncharacterized protein n=1 Tax=Ancylostoma caninum TaxID=29170 RepID=A0A368F6A4_ANCCA|nr:hypothetical protein ANCCAN_27149 [Ancylostoma caninum]
MANIPLKVTLESPTRHFAFHCPTDKMGHGHHEPFQIPKYTIYDNYKQFPELAAHEKRLAQIGLKDPWIR